MYVPRPTLDPRWFQSLVKKEGRRGSLMDTHNITELSSKIVVACETDFGYKYAVFNDRSDLYAYIMNSRVSERRLHEVVLPGMYQKPRFDIDIEMDEIHQRYKPHIIDREGRNIYPTVGLTSPLHADGVTTAFPSTATGSCLQTSDVASALPSSTLPSNDIMPMTFLEYGEMIKDKLIDAVMALLAKDGIYLDLSEHVIVCSTHRESKVSYHVIIDGYMHGSEEEAKAFFQEVIKISDEPDLLLSALDDSVYKGNQNFRLLWNHKMGMSVVKLMEEEFMYNGEPYKHVWKQKVINEHHFNIMMLETTMLTTISSCEVLPLYLEEAKADNTVLTDEDAELAFSLLRDKWVEEQALIHSLIEKEKRKGDDPARACKEELTYKKSPLPFDIVSVDNNPSLPFHLTGGRKGGLIYLARDRPSYCSVCEKVHMKMPPCLYIRCGKVYFTCRRSIKHKGKKISTFLGTIPYTASVPPPSEIISDTDSHYDSNGNIDSSLNALIQSLEKEKSTGTVPSTSTSAPIFTPPSSSSVSTPISTPGIVSIASLPSSSPVPRHITLVSPQALCSAYPASMAPRPQSPLESVNELLRHTPPKEGKRRKKTVVTTLPKTPTTMATEWSSSIPLRKNMPMM
jgi:hypothetical protein